MSPHSRDWFSPELWLVDHPRKSRGRREDRVAAAPGAPAQKRIARAREPQVQAVVTPASPAQWFYGLYVLSSVNQRLPPSPRASSCTKLGACIGAPGPHDFAVRARAARRSTRLTSTTSRPTFVTTAIRPSCRGGTGGTIRLILPSKKPKYFSARDLTGIREVRPPGKSLGIHDGPS
jgi:hypothetical protein